MHTKYPVQRLLLFFFFLLLPFSVNSKDIRVGIYAFTHHFASGEYNDHHPMIQLEHRQGWIGGVYLNSASRWSWYGGYRKYMPNHRLFVELGAATGYDATLSRSIRLGIEINRHFDFLIMPGFRDPYSWTIDQPISVTAIVVKF